MRQSFFPLLHPVFWTLISMLALMGVERFRGNDSGLFGPLPAAEAVAIVWSAWALKLLADLISAPQMPLWIWHARDIEFFIVVLVVMSWRYFQHSASDNGNAANTVARTGVGMFMFLVGAVAWPFAVGQGWPLGAG